jgi:hypothetical protein
MAAWLSLLLWKCRFGAEQMGCSIPVDCEAYGYHGWCYIVRGSAYKLYILVSSPAPRGIWNLNAYSRLVQRSESLPFSSIVNIRSTIHIASDRRDFMPVEFWM